MQDRKTKLSEPTFWMWAKCLQFCKCKRMSLNETTNGSVGTYKLQANSIAQKYLWPIMALTFMTGISNMKPQLCPHARKFKIKRDFTKWFHELVGWVKLHPQTVYFLVHFALCWTWAPARLFALMIYLSKPWIFL